MTIITIENTEKNIKKTFEASSIAFVALTETDNRVEGETVRLLGKSIAERWEIADILRTLSDEIKADTAKIILRSLPDTDDDDGVALQEAMRKV